jgi:hypothetical protein
MATVVLTTLGGAVGGPVGAALGGLAGRAIDGAVFGQRGREGPRLRELQVQTSSYGTAIPELFGTMRVAGTVIWATDLKESAATGGKGAARSTQYSYSASFAVALSARPIRAVRRIWAEGKLLRGAAGDWKTRTGFRLHVGDEAQAPDPLIASIVGIGNAPAHRGIAYAVFEDLALADFGNRIPSLTFEVEADAGPVTVGTIVERLGGGAIRAEAAGPMLAGFAASGDSLRDAIEALVVPVGGWYAPDGAGTLLRIGDGPARTLRDAGAVGGGWRRPPTVPADIAVAYHDVARDYQAGVQQVLRPGGARRQVRIELPAAMTAGDAAAIAGDAAARLALAGEVRTVLLDWRDLDIVPGDRIMIPGEAGRWRVRSVKIEAMRLTIEAVRIAAATLPPVAAAGNARLAQDVVPGATRLLLVELPGDGSVPVVAAIAGGTGPGWRRAALLAGDDTGGWREIGGTAAAGVIGTVTLPPGDAPATIEDWANIVEVTLLHDAMTLESVDAVALDRGANAALIGDEIVQFGEARRIAPGRWRLSRLWRGRRGSDGAIAGHRAGEAFALLDPATLKIVDDLAPAVGRPLSMMAAGIGDDGMVATITPDGRALVPPAPVHLRAVRDGAVLTIGWVRRARSSETWRDAVDMPLVEEREAYRVTLTDGAGTRSIDTAEPRVTLMAPTGPVAIEVRQTGTHGASRAATLLYRPELS